MANPPVRGCVELNPPDASLTRSQRFRTPLNSVSSQSEGQANEAVPPSLVKEKYCPFGLRSLASLSAAAVVNATAGSSARPFQLPLAKYSHINCGEPEPFSLRRKSICTRDPPREKTSLLAR